MKAFAEADERYAKMLSLLAGAGQGGEGDGLLTRCRALADCDRLSVHLAVGRLAQR